MSDPNRQQGSASESDETENDNKNENASSGRLPSFQSLRNFLSSEDHPPSTLPSMQSLPFFSITQTTGQFPDPQGLSSTPHTLPLPSTSQIMEQSLNPSSYHYSPLPFSQISTQPSTFSNGPPLTFPSSQPLTLSSSSQASPHPSLSLSRGQSWSHSPQSCTLPPYPDPSLPSPQSLLHTPQPLAQPSDPFPLTLQPLAQPSDPLLLTFQPLAQPSDPFPLTFQPVAQPSDPLPLTLQPLAQPSDPFPLTFQPRAQPSDPLPLTLQPLAQPSDPFPLTLQPLDQPSDPLPLTLQPLDQTSQPFSLTSQPFTQPSDHIPPFSESLTSSSQLVGEQIYPSTSIHLSPQLFHLGDPQQGDEYQAGATDGGTLDPERATRVPYSFSATTIQSSSGVSGTSRRWNQQGDGNQAGASGGIAWNTEYAPILSLSYSSSGCSTIQGDPGAPSTSGYKAPGQLGTSTTQGSQQCQQRKLKMYQLPEQEDPKLEKDRLRAKDRKKRREEQKALTQNRKDVLQRVERENAIERGEIARKKTNINRLSSEVEQMERIVQDLQARGVIQTNRDEDTSTENDDSNSEN
ncbi:hypothetical protein Pcinc_024688 [Petrolisthes cinctipes]|uniref:Uncharacterized protein n=1 Tax=Petrolisthes cinctipes TaxID=88211 RepID=A0AAE1KD61_PETCI|nr:hypothetical protein Pcinc_024688 [Petrolisthes cinctipes]